MRRARVRSISGFPLVPPRQRTKRQASHRGAGMRRRAPRPPGGPGRPAHRGQQAEAAAGRKRQDAAAARLETQQIVVDKIAGMDARKANPRPHGGGGAGCPKRGPQARQEAEPEARPPRAAGGGRGRTPTGRRGQRARRAAAQAGRRSRRARDGQRDSGRPQTIRPGGPSRRMRRAGAGCDGPYRGRGPEGRGSGRRPRRAMDGPRPAGPMRRSRPFTGELRPPGEPLRIEAYIRSSGMGVRPCRGGSLRMRSACNASSRFRDGR
jgi:hypothetical protein